MIGMTATELKAAIDAWIEKYIRQEVAFSAGGALTATRLNELFNLLIVQGDNASQAIAYIRDFLTVYMSEIDATIATKIVEQYDAWVATNQTAIDTAIQNANIARDAANASKTAADTATQNTVTATGNANTAATAANASKVAADNATAAANAAALAYANHTHPKSAITDFAHTHPMSEITGFYDYRPNLLINGDFQVWQRGITFSPVQAGSPYIADRWIPIGYSANNVAKYDKDVNGIKLTPLVNGSNFGIGQRLENRSKYAGKIITVSCSIDNVIYAHTFTAPTADAYLEFDVNANLKFTLVHNTASDYMAVYVGLINVTATKIINWVKAEFNDHATPLLTRSFDDELRSCQRYFCKSFAYSEIPQNGSAADNFYGVDNGVTGNVSCGSFTFMAKSKFPVTMRAVPTITIYGNNVGAVLQQNLATGAATWETTQITKRATVDGIGVYRAVAGNLMILYHFSADAEI